VYISLSLLINSAGIQKPMKKKNDNKSRDDKLTREAPEVASSL